MVLKQHDGYRITLDQPCTDAPVYFLKNSASLDDIAEDLQRIAERSFYAGYEMGCSDEAA